MENVFLNGPDKFLEYLQTLNHIKAAEAEQAVDTIATILKNIAEGDAFYSLNTTKRQTLLSLAFRSYKQIILKHNLQTRQHTLRVEDFLALESGIKPNELKQINYELLYAFLQIENETNVDAENVVAVCLKDLGECRIDQVDVIFIILRTINFMIRKHNTLEPVVELGQIYAYLQINQHGLREEVLLFFSHCCKSLDTAKNYFNFILQYYPWTHRNKYLLLSCVFQNSNSLETLLQQSGQRAGDFFDGLRLSLAYKRLHSPSQYLVKALSQQDSLGLLELAVTILATGKFKEIQNFHANWFSRISQKEAILKLLLERLDIDVILKNFAAQTDEIEEYRFVLIFSMFCRQIHYSSKVDFFRISTELITNCFRFQAETKVLIYKFVVDNLNCFALEDILEYLITFIVAHKNVDNPQMRNNILGKISAIINYVAKFFRKAQKKLKDTLEAFNASIVNFFVKLNQLIELEIESKIYQPKIYALKLLEILLKSLFQEKLEKNAKNCIVNENETLGKFLISKGAFNSSDITEKLIKTLNDPTGFDDALDLIVELLKRMPGTLSSLNLVASCQRCCESFDIDECNLSTRYALVVLGACGNVSANCLALHKYALEKLTSVLVLFQADPLNTCKSHCHIFGFINIINITISSTQVGPDNSNLIELVNIFEFIVNLILELLLKSPLADHKDEAPTAASFQDMDQSLQLLVENSSFHTENSEECRKFLLMTFWMTLKACCDTATTLGIIFAGYENNEIDYENLQRCLNINVAVLTRCRHKGAIEAAGLSIGKLTKHLTAHKTSSSMINKMLCDALNALFLKENLVSTTRRGAGFSIMFLHVVKNDAQIEKPILKHVMQEIFQLLRENPTTQPNKETNNCDRIEALCLHYLGVLAKDAELRDDISGYRNEIMLAAIRKIDDPEWTICNAALQLFGALIPKIVGQKQATEPEVVTDDWDTAVVTFAEIANCMPETIEYIMNYCQNHACQSRFTRSIILFLGFLSKLEHLAQHDVAPTEHCLVYRLRELMWLLLQHHEEKVRKLAALVFVRAHEFHYELPQILLALANVMFSLSNENFFQGCIFVIQFGVLKMRHEALHTIDDDSFEYFMQTLRAMLSEHDVFKKNVFKFKFYTQCKFLEMLHCIGFESEATFVSDLIKSLTHQAQQTNLSLNYEDFLQQLNVELRLQTPKLKSK